MLHGGYSKPSNVRYNHKVCKPHAALLKISGAHHKKVGFSMLVLDVLHIFSKDCTGLAYSKTIQIIFLDTSNSLLKYLLITRILNVYTVGYSSPFLNGVFSSLIVITIFI